MYLREFYPNWFGDTESSMGSTKNLIGLPKAHLDESTKKTVEMMKSG